MQKTAFVSTIYRECSHSLTLEIIQQKSCETVDNKNMALDIQQILSHTASLDDILFQLTQNSA